MFKTIIDEMLKGNFSFLILIVGILQLIVMIKKRKKEQKMTPQVYANLKELTTGELLSAINRLRENMHEQGADVDDADMQYFIALMQELDSRDDGSGDI